MKALLAIRNGVFHRELLPRINKIANKPSTVHISITDKCNLSCRMCKIWAKKTPELTLDEWKKVVLELKKWLGSYNLKIAGGEPLMRKDLLDLLTYANSLGIYTGISSNGFLIDEKMAENLIQAGLNEIHISFDSTKPVIHDSLRNKKGVHAKAKEAILLLKKYKEKEKSQISIDLACIINEKNISELKEIVDFVKDNNLQSVNFQPLQQNFGEEYSQNWFENSLLWPKDNAKVRQAIDYLILRRKEDWLIGNSESQLEAMKKYFTDPLERAAVSCKAGMCDIAITPDGKMLLCFSLDAVGNIRQELPSQIWSGKKAGERRAEIACCRRNCNLLNCNFEA